MTNPMLRGALIALLLATPAAAQTPPAPPPTGAAQPAPPRPLETFPTPEAGFAALAAAIGRQDEAALLRMLGRPGLRLVRSGDAVADRAAGERFAAAYAAKHEILQPGPGLAVLQVGEDGWPLPIPLRQRGRSWRFDAAAGAQEIIDRRIGRNELDTIETLRAIADAERDYARTAGAAGGLRAYAQRFFSTPGSHDGLYWESAPGEPESPLGQLAAAASTGGYARPQPGDRPQPYHGYLFRILEAQGPAAPGGARSFLVDGRMVGGFAVVAAPARYGSTGIKTFMISHDGVVWERDLGPETARLAAAIERFDPGEGWQRVAE